MKELSEKYNDKGAIAWMAGNSVAANLLMLVLLIGGVLLGMRVKQELFPEFSMDMVMVTVAYPGASPEEVEKAIVLAVEEAVRGLDDVDEVTSTSQEGMGTVVVEMLVGGDIQKLTQDIKSEVDRIVSFPEEAEEPQVMEITRRRQVISLVLYGEQDERILRETGETIRDRLLQDAGITQVELSAVRPYEISIEIPQEKLRTYNLTLEGVADKIRRASVELPGGGIKTIGGEILLRMKERRDYGEEFASIPIVSLNDGTELLLEDIAVVKDGFEDIDKYAIYNGQPAVMINVYRVGDQTPIQVADKVKKHAQELGHTLPPGIHIDVWRDFSDKYRQRLDLLLRNGYLGLALVFILLAVFLEARLAFWVTMGIPISFIGSLLFLPIIGVTINMVSLFAFIIALGIVVDDAIVVGENIYEYHQRGLPFLEAAMRGARQMAVPVTFSILTNIVAFMPIFFVPGVTGKIFKVIPAVVVTVFLISLVEALFILPAHLGHQKDRRFRGLMGWLHHRQQIFSSWFSHSIKKYYGPLLDWTLRYRYAAISFGIALLILTIAFVKSGRLGMTMFPKVEADIAVATAVLPYGSSAEKTEVVRQQLLDAANEIIKENGGDDLVRGIFAEIGAVSITTGFGGPPGGTSGGHVGAVQVFLTEPERRPLSTGEFVKLWRKRTGAIAGIDSIRFEDDRAGPGSGAALTIELSHRDLKVLEAASADLAGELSYFPKVRDIDDGFTPGKEQIDFTILPEGESLGLSAMNVARQVRGSFYGVEVVRQQRGRNEMKIMVRLPKEERISEYNIEELMLRSPAGGEILLREAVQMKRGRAYTAINRREDRRAVNITANVTPQSETGRIIKSLESDILPKLIKKYPGLGYGYEGKQADIKKSMRSLVGGFAMAMMAMYALLAIPFRSYTQPLIIMVSIPFGMVGAVVGHIIMGYSLSVMSMFGVVALSGVVVNDVLILVDFANNQRRKGLSYHEAIHSAGVRRFRPIILTTLTTFGGLAPMIFERSLQAKFLIPMAISLGYGILFATVITLLMAPSLYMILEDGHKLLAAIRRFYGSESGEL